MAFLKFLVAILVVLVAMKSFATETSCQSLETSVKALAEQIIICEAELAKQPNTLSVNAQIQLSDLYRKSGDTNKASLILNELLKQSKSMNVSTQYDIAYSLGVNHFFARDFTSSLQSFLQAFSYAKKIEKPQPLAHVFNALANLAQVSSDYSAMSVLLERSFTIFQIEQNEQCMAKVLNNLGNAYRLNHQHNKALATYRRALVLHQTQENTLKAAHTQLNMARALVSLEQSEKAQVLLESLISTFANIGAIQRQIEAHGVLASIFNSNGNYENAERQIQTIQSLKLQVDNNYFDPGSELASAEFYRLTQQFQQTESILLKGLEKTTEQKNVLQQERYLKALASLYAEQENHTKATYYWKSHSAVLTKRLENKQIAVGELAPVLAYIESTNNSLDKNQVFGKVQTLWLVIFLVLCSVGVLSWKIYKKHQLFNLSMTAPSKIHKPIVTEIHHVTSNSSSNKALQDKRSQLVELMMLSVQLWEQDKQLDVLELAERSKIWKVTVDDGRLRARALERYLKIDKLPANPRWRNVIRTCHFVLSECEAPSPLRTELSGQLSEYLQSVKKQAVS